MNPRQLIQTALLAELLTAGPSSALAQQIPVALTNVAQLDFQGVKGEIVDYKHRTALKLVEASQSDAAKIAVVKNVAMQDGTIEVEVSGAPTAGASEGARGFVGVAFRVSADGKRFEYIYLRPTNGRTPDQIRRNHSVQYASHPDYPWQRLRKEEPEKYETYVDLEPAVWTKVRIVVAGRSAKLFVHGAAQPTLVVNDLKLDPQAGGIALWIGPGTEAHFSNLTVNPTPRQ